MKCKYCEAELAQWGGFCPVCGKRNTEEEVGAAPQDLLSFESEEMERPVQEEVAEPETQQDDEGPSPKLKKAKRLAAMSGCIALLTVLATVLFFGIRGGWDVSNWFDWLKPRENNVLYRDTYTVKDKKMERKRDKVVATMGELELTNAQLQFYYWTEVYDFLENYGYYLSYIGFDYSAPLDTQACYFDSTLTWQQYFLKSALDVWQSNAAFAQLAKQNGFELPTEYQESLDTMVESLTATAKKKGYDDVNDLVQESFGAGVTVEDYLQYMEVYYYGYLYFAELYEEIDPSVEELEAYFRENQTTLEASGIKQNGSYTVDVRHILVLIETIAKEETDQEDTDSQAEDDQTDDSEKYTEEQGEACRAAAQKILDEYLGGELTEERFGELANKYSEDQRGEVTDGGIYTFVEKGEMVAEFDAWCFDEIRKPGDTDLVKTKFGYHVMYFVGSEETWLTKTRSAYLSAKSDEIVANALSQFTMEVQYKKIVLNDVKL